MKEIYKQKTNYRLSMILYERQLIEYFTSKDNILLAYIFGSTVRGNIGRLSDIDIAILVDEKSSKKEHLDVELKILSEITILIKREKIDLIILNEAPLLLAYNVIKNGIILKSNEIERVKFEIKIISTYLDQQYYINRHTEMSINRIAEVGFA
jgi:predicted nucleotidyltransferase